MIRQLADENYYMISIIIPVYKNTSLFIKNLKHNLPFLTGCQIIIVNDDPETSLKNELKNFKNITLIENKKNLGFGGTVNRGVQEAKNQYLMFLNSDVVLNDKSYVRGLDYFRDKSLFGISFSQKEKDDTIVGKNKIYWLNGFFAHQRATNLQPGDNGWAEGGSCLIDKEKFLRLGGFDPLYSPFYWEDIDLSYRAWKTGYRIIFEPKILVKHHHETTINKYFTKVRVKTIAYRNQLIFIWKNLTDRQLIYQHLLFLPITVLKSLVKFDYIFLAGFIKALLNLPWIVINRFHQKKMFSVSDETVLKLFKNE